MDEYSDDCTLEMGFTNPGEWDVELEVTDGKAGCADTDSLTFGLSNTCPAISLGEPIEMKVKHSQKIKPKTTDLEGDDVSCEWSTDPEDGLDIEYIKGNGEIDPNGCDSIMITGVKAGAYWLKVLITDNKKNKDGNKCDAGAWLTVNVLEEEAACNIYTLEEGDTFSYEGEGDIFTLDKIEGGFCFLSTSDMMDSPLDGVVPLQVPYFTQYGFFDSSVEWKLLMVGLLDITDNKCTFDIKEIPVDSFNGICIPGVITKKPEPICNLDFPTPSAQEMIDDDPWIGNPDAKVVMVMFGGFATEASNNFYKDTWPQIKAKYIDTKKIKFVFKNYAFDLVPNDQEAAIASECANEQGKHWEYFEALFQSYDPLTKDTLLELGIDVGIPNMVKFESCIDSQKYKDETQCDYTQTSPANIPSSPGFYINDVKIQGAVLYSSFKSVLDKELAKP